MKKIVLICLSVYVLLPKTHSQIQTPAMSGHKIASDALFAKAKKQKKTAWVLLGVGTAMAAGGLISFGHNYNYGSNTATDISGFVMLGGIVADIVSIPFFVSASKNKKKAQMAIANENVFLSTQGYYKNHIIAFRVNVRL